MHIGKRLISSTTAPYVIAELGVNHDGSVERALELTRGVAQTGCEAVKLQLFRADLLLSRTARLTAYQESAGEKDPAAMLARLELSVDQMAPVVELAHELGLHAIVTVFSVELVEDARRLAWDAYKVASPDIIHRPLLEALEATGKPIIVSTGAATLQEVGRALSWLRGARERVAVLQCVSCYPTPEDRAELGGIGALHDIFDGVVGYSDHTTSLKAGALAVAAGASILEKHVTYDVRAAGPDHAASLAPAQLRKYRAYAYLTRRYERDPKSRPYLDTFITAEIEEEAFALVQRLRGEQGKGEKMKRVLDIEEDVRKASRQSIVAARDLAAGHVVTREDVTFKRPGTGLGPHKLEAIVGRRLARGVSADVMINKDDLA